MADFNLGTAIQDVLTRGLDAAKTVALARFQVNDPTGQVTGPNGTKAQVGQPAGALGAAVSAIPPAVWIGGALLLGVVLVVTLKRR